MSSVGLRSLIREFGTFGIIGVGGFLVDSAALYGAMHAFGLGLYSGRLVSWLAAATFTWYFNRRFTFASDVHTPAPLQWARFLSANALGGILNYAVYAALVAGVDVVRQWPLLGVAAGSVAGLSANFLLSRRYVFSR